MLIGLISLAFIGVYKNTEFLKRSDTSSTPTSSPVSPADSRVKKEKDNEELRLRYMQEGRELAGGKHYKEALESFKKASAIYPDESLSAIIKTLESKFGDRDSGLSSTLSEPSPDTMSPAPTSEESLMEEAERVCHDNIMNGSVTRGGIGYVVVNAKLNGISRMGKNGFLAKYFARLDSASGANSVAIFSCLIRLSNGRWLMEIQ